MGVSGGRAQGKLDLIFDPFLLFLFIFCFFFHLWNPKLLDFGGRGCRQEVEEVVGWLKRIEAGWRQEYLVE